MADKAKKRLDVFTVREADGPNGKAWWTKIGAAFENKDGSWSVVLDALPVDGRLQLREPYVDPDAPGAEKPASQYPPRGSRR